MRKSSDQTKDFDVKKIQKRLEHAGCHTQAAIKIVELSPNNSIESVLYRMVIELMRRGCTDQTIQYESYRAGFGSNSLRILKQKYPLHDTDGPAEMPNQMFGRVVICMILLALDGMISPHTVHGFAVTQLRLNICNTKPCKQKGGIQKFHNYTKQCHDLMCGRRFLPNIPTLMSAGVPLGYLSICSVLEVPDNLDGIVDVAKNMVLIFQSGGNVGINYSALRPAGSMVSSMALTASGSVSFMEFVDGVSDVIKQGGRRRAANMGILYVHHKDMRRFIDDKHNHVLTNLNISVGTDETFWDDIKRYNPQANHILNKITASVRCPAEPDVISLDSINKHNALYKTRDGLLRATNPCWGGETKVLTKDGPVSFRDLAMGPSQVQVLTREEDGTLSYRAMQNPGITTQGAEVVCLVLESEQTGECSALRCTPTHNVCVVYGTELHRTEVQNLTPGMSLHSVYEDGDTIHQTLGVSAKSGDIPVMPIHGTGHPTPSILPLRLASRKGKAKKAKGKSEGFMTHEGATPDVDTGKGGGLLYRLLGRNHKVLGVIRLGRTDVYNGMVDVTHNYFVQCGDADYILSGNCGEQVLYLNESYSLGSINISSSYVTEHDTVNRAALDRAIRTCARMPGGVAEMAVHVTPATGMTSNETRRIRLGVMGVAYMMMHLGCRNITVYMDGFHDTQVLSSCIMYNDPEPSPVAAQYLEV